MALDKKTGTNEYGKDFSQFPEVEGNAFAGVAKQMTEAANEMVEAFTASRARVSEMNTAVSEAAPRMRRLGASFIETTTAMKDIAAATQKQTLASSDSVAKLHATTKVIGEDTKRIVNNFTDVGIQFGVIGSQLEKSVVTVRDLGLNVKSVMQDVVNYASDLNKFNFEGGVKGLTKMAASASMLRVDMSATLNFADKILGNPEEAVKMASAFQRLGVSVGNLVDPYSLMNDAMNDPEKIQGSLAKAAQQFTYFDEKAKSFRINPQGILTLKEIANESGIAYSDLTKMGLAAAETGKRISQINPSIKFENDSDKQFLSNLSEMNESGEYTVKITNAQGDVETKKLSDVTQQEFNKLIDEQKKQPKTMEDIARASMKQGDIVKNDVHAIKEAVVRGIVSTSFVKDNLESLRKLTTVPFGAASNQLARTEIFSKPSNEVIGAMKTAVKDLIKGNSASDVVKELNSKLKLTGEQSMIVMQDVLKNMVKEIDSKGFEYNDSEIGKLATATYKGLKDLASSKSEKNTSGVSEATTNAAIARYNKISGYGTESLSNASNLASSKSEKNTSGVSEATTNAAIARYNKISGYGTESLSNASNPNQTLTSAIGETNRTSKDDVTFTLKIDAPPGVNEQYLEQIFKTEKFKQMIYTYIQQKNIELEKTKR